MIRSARGSAGLAVAFLVLSTSATLAAEPAARTEWVFSRGMSIRQIARESYGHPAFDEMVTKFNRVDPRRIRAGTIIKTPPLPEMFEELGLIPEYSEAFTTVFGVLDGYKDLLKVYRPLRRQAGGYRQAGSLHLPADMKAGFLRLADSLDRAARLIERRSQAKGNVPRRTLRQFQQSEGWLRRLASGRMDGFGYDEDEVWKRLAYGLANAVAWSRE